MTHPVMLKDSDRTLQQGSSWFYSLVTMATSQFGDSDCSFCVYMWKKETSQHLLIPLPQIRFFVQSQTVRKVLEVLIVQANLSKNFVHTFLGNDKFFLKLCLCHSGV